MTPKRLFTKMKVNRPKSNGTNFMNSWAPSASRAMLVANEVVEQLSRELHAIRHHGSVARRYM